jgi:aspartate aminotransferase
MRGKTTPNGKTMNSDLDFTDYLLEDAHVAVVRGSAFGLSLFLPISYTPKKAELVEALERIGRACNAL